MVHGLLSMQVFDADGNGRIELKEAIALTWTIKHLPSCSCCSSPILPLVSQAYCCMACIDDVKAQHEQDTCGRFLYGTPFNADSDSDDDECSGGGSGRGGPLVSSLNTTFLCRKCHVEKQKGCARHGTASMLASHDRRLKRCVPAPAVMVIPGAEDNMHTCLCCGETHSLVVSYLRPHLKDLHMRPVMVRGASGASRKGQGNREGNREGKGCLLYIKEVHLAAQALSCSLAFALPLPLKRGPKSPWQMAQRSFQLMAASSQGASARSLYIRVGLILPS